jgi:hypothetical protein
MNPPVPLIRQPAWGVILLQLLALWGGGIVVLISTRSFPATILYGFAFVLYGLSAQRLFLSNHRRGVRLMKDGQLEEAIDEFEASYRYFQTHPAIDSFRAITTGSGSAVSYREMALLNIAFCYCLLGEGQKARSSYESTLSEFPKSVWANAAMTIINAIENTANAGTAS